MHTTLLVFVAATILSGILTPIEANIFSNIKNRITTAIDDRDRPSSSINYELEQRQIQSDRIDELLKTLAILTTEISELKRQANINKVQLRNATRKGEIVGRVKDAEMKELEEQLRAEIEALKMTNNDMVAQHEADKLILVKELKERLEATHAEKMNANSEQHVKDIEEYKKKLVTSQKEGTIQIEQIEELKMKMKKQSNEFESKETSLKKKQTSLSQNIKDLHEKLSKEKLLQEQTSEKTKNQKHQIKSVSGSSKKHAEKPTSLSNSHKGKVSTPTAATSTPTSKRPSNSGSSRYK